MNEINSTVICNYESGISRIIINDPATYNALSSKTLKSKLYWVKSVLFLRNPMGFPLLSHTYSKPTSSLFSSFG